VAGTAVDWGGGVRMARFVFAVERYRGGVRRGKERVGEAVERRGGWGWGGGGVRGEGGIHGGAEEVREGGVWAPCRGC